MKTELVTAEIIVKENKVGILRVGNVNYKELFKDRLLKQNGDIIDLKGE